MWSHVKPASVHALLIVCLAVTGCGFRPLYGSNTPTSHKVQQHMHAIALGKVPPGKLGQLLSHGFETRFAALGKERAVPRYHLNLELREKIIPLIVRQDGSVSRYNIEHKLNMTLIADQTGEAVFSDKITTLTGYNTEDSDYASYVAQQSTQERSVNEIVKQATARLASFFSRHFGVGSPAAAQAS